MSKDCNKCKRGNAGVQDGVQDAPQPDRSGELWDDIAAAVEESVIPLKSIGIRMLREVIEPILLAHIEAALQDRHKTAGDAQEGTAE